MKSGISLRTHFSQSGNTTNWPTPLLVLRKLHFIQDLDDYSRNLHKPETISQTLTLWLPCRHRMRGGIFDARQSCENQCLEHAVNAQKSDCSQSRARFPAWIRFSQLYCRRAASAAEPVRQGCAD